MKRNMQKLPYSNRFRATWILCHTSHMLYIWGNVLVHVEEVCRIVFLLQSKKALVVFSKSLTDSLFAFVTQIVHVGRTLIEWLHRLPALPRPMNVLLSFSRIIPSRQRAAVVVIVTVRKSCVTYTDATSFAMKLLHVDKTSGCQRHPLSMFERCFDEPVINLADQTRFPVIHPAGCEEIVKHALHLNIRALLNQV